MENDPYDKVGLRGRRFNQHLKSVRTGFRSLREQLTIRLPAAVVEVLALKEGDEIEITVTDSQMFKVSRAELLERLRAFRERLPPDFKFDRDEANARSFS